MSDESRYYENAKARGREGKSTPLGPFESVFANKQEEQAAQRGWEAGQSAREHAEAIQEKLDATKEDSDADYSYLSGSDYSSSSGNGGIINYVPLIVLAIVAFVAWKHSYSGNSVEYQGNTQVPPISAGNIVPQNRNPVKYYLDINPNTFVGLDVNAFIGGGKYFHWMLADTDVMMDVCINGNGADLHREFARSSPHWTRYNPSGVINRIDFRMTPGQKGTLKTSARVIYWYDGSPNDE